MIQQEMDSLLRFACDALGDSIHIEDYSRSFGRKSTTWRITAPGEREYYLKRHEDRRHYFAEVRALDDWAGCLPDEPWWSVPEVISTSDELGAVIMTGLPGSVLEETPVQSSTRTKLFELAGSFANLLHSCQMDLSPISRSNTYR